MAQNFIAVDLSSKYGRDVVHMRNQLLEASKACDALKDLMLNMIDGSDYSWVETYFGVATGKGEALYNMVNGTAGELAADSNLQTLIDIFNVTTQFKIQGAITKAAKQSLWFW